MVIKRIISVCVLLSLPVLTLFAQDKTYKAPKQSEVVIVSRVELTPTPRDSFYLQYRAINENNYYSYIWDVVKGQDKTTTMLAVAEFKRRDYYLNKEFFLGIDRGIDSIKVDIPNDRVIKLTYMKVNLANLNIFSVILPLQVEFTVPEGVNYVYIGSFEYECKGFGLEITGVKSTDEYDKAAEFVRAKYGQNASLARVPLRQISEEDRKKIAYNNY